MMKRTLASLLILVLASAVLVLIAPAAVADPGNGHGLGTCKLIFNNKEKRCLKICGEPPTGCHFFECTKCGCDVVCDDGATRNVPAQVWSLEGAFGVPASMSPTDLPPERSWDRIFHPLRWPVPLN